MENIIPEVPIQTPIIEPQCIQTPTPPPYKPCNELRKPVTPDHLKLPKAFKYPERYHFWNF